MPKQADSYIVSSNKGDMIQAGQVGYIKKLRHEYLKVILNHLEICKSRLGFAPLKGLEGVFCVRNHIYVRIL